MKVTKIFKKTLKYFIDPNVRIIFNYGGSSSSKTISILQLILLYGLKHKNKTITIVSQTLPKIKRGPLRDFQRIILQGKLKFLKTKTYFNKSELIYTLPNESIIQFLSADSEDKIISLRTDVLYFDELNHIKKSIYDQLSIRTKYKILASWNPASIFYANQEFDRKDVKIIHSTYKDNPFIDKSIINELIEKGKKDKNFRRVYIEGKPGVLEGLIFEEDVNYKIVDEIPNKKLKKIVFGLDYGFFDPTALVELRLFEDKSVWVKEHLYKTKLTPDLIVKSLQDLNLPKHSKIIAESARPELTTYIHRFGFNIHKVQKTEILVGINKMKDYFMYIDKNSKNLITELRNYAWEKDKNGSIIEKPIDDYNHCFRADTMILSQRGNVRIDELNTNDKVLTRNGLKKINWVGKSKTSLIKKHMIYIDALRYVELYVTDDHLIKTKEKIWEKIQDLQEGDTIYLHKNLMEKFTHYTKEKNIIQKEEKDYIELYGNFIMEKYYQDFIYITKIKTLQITKLKIWNVLKHMNIYQNIQKKDLKIIKNGLKNFKKKELKVLKNGINQKKEENGIKNMQKNLIGVNQIYQKKNVYAVKKNSNQQIINKNIVQINVNQKQEEIQEWITSPEYANIVEKNLQSINILKKNIVQDLVPIKIKKIKIENVGVEDVYDISVDEIPEYFANGILVHNCVDGIRYAETMFKKGGTLKIYD